MRVTVTEDVESFMLEVPGASGSLVRRGPTTSATRIAIEDVGSAHLAMLEFGFPVLAEAVAHDRALVVTHMLHAPGPGRWDGVDLEPGMSFVYPPGADHAATDPPGLRFALAAVPWERFVDAAATLEVDPDVAARQRAIPPTTAVPPEWLTPFVPSADDCFRGDQVLDSLVRCLTDGPPEETKPTRRRWDDRDLVHESIAFLDTCTAWRVPVLSLCRHVGVSERRLQTAFQHVFDMGPHRYMHLRAVQAAHQALLVADPSTTTVGSIATEFGFHHGGRFAREYSATFGELPSRTLRRS